MSIDDILKLYSHGIITKDEARGLIAKHHGELGVPE